MFVLKNADCLGQDLDPAKEYYAQKDIPNVRRMVLLELIRLKIISGTAAATLPASIDPKGDGDTKVGIETKERPSIDPKLCDKGSGESKGGITALENRDRERDTISDHDDDRTLKI
jgi:hypothetical protein